MAFATITRYEAGIRPKVAWPEQARTADGTPGPNFRYDTYCSTLARGLMVARLTLPKPVTGRSVVEAIGTAIKGSEGQASQARLVCSVLDPLLLGRTGRLAQLHLAVLAPDGDPVENNQPATLLARQGRYTQLALATVSWPEVQTEMRTSQAQAALSALVFANRLDDPLQLLSIVDNPPNLQS